MKALEVVQETDPQGTVIGVRGIVHVSASPIPPLLWFLALTAAILLLALVCLRPANGAADDIDTIILRESGHFSGSGHREISASGPLCEITIQPANESLLAAGNGTVWVVLQNGSLREVV